MCNSVFQCKFWCIDIIAIESLCYFERYLTFCWFNWWMILCTIFLSCDRSSDRVVLVSVENMLILSTFWNLTFMLVYDLPIRCATTESSWDSLAFSAKIINLSWWEFSRRQGSFWEDLTNYWAKLIWCSASIEFKPNLHVSYYPNHRSVESWLGVGGHRCRPIKSQELLHFSSSVSINKISDRKKGPWGLPHSKRRKCFSAVP